MYKNWIYLGITSLLLFNCEDNIKSNNNPISIEKEWLKYEVGQTWTYKRMFINEGSYIITGIPDTLYGYSEYEVIKDTIFENTTWLIVEGKDYECNKDVVDEYKSKYAISFTDKLLKVYEFKFGLSRFTSGPFKRTAYSENIFKSDFSSIRNLSKKLLSVKMGSANYDPMIFSDLRFPLAFNVSSGYSWSIRSADDPNQNIPVEKVYLGIENITVPAGAYDAHKFELLASIDLIVYSWYANNGMIKESIDFGVNDIFNDNGICIGFVHSWNILEYLGPRKIDSSCIIPWGQ